MLIEMLEKEMQELKVIIRNMEKRKKNNPQGTLRISQKKTGPEYYVKTYDKISKTGNVEYAKEKEIEYDNKKHPKEKEIEYDNKKYQKEKEIKYEDKDYVSVKDIKPMNGHYLKKKDIKIAKEIAQRDYDVKLLKYAKARLHSIEMFLKKYEETDIKVIFQKMHPSRRELIDEIIISDEEYVKRWSEAVYTGKEFQDYESVIVTEKGERVRSKSEKIIADKLNLLGIPYRYEYPILLEGNIKIYPDFTILKMPERKEVYLEHFGRIDDVNYIDTTILKLNTYEKNGIFLGIQLFFTYETSKKPLNMKALDKMLKELFCQ